MNIEKSMKNLNHMSIPSITSPFGVRIYWFQYHKKAPEFLLKNHRHSFFEVHFMVEGETLYEFQGKNVKVESGETLLISPSVEHSVSKYSEEYQKFAIGFAIDEDNKTDVGNKICKLLSSSDYLIISKSSVFISLCRYALSLCENVTQLTPFRVKDVVFAIIDELLKAVGGLGRFELNAFGEFDSRIAIAKRYVMDNIRRPFTLSEVSSRVCLSEKQLCRVFLQVENQSLAQFIKEERLKEAKLMLTNSDEPLKNISEALGWSNEYNFIRFFRNAEGVTPAVFRKIIKNK